MGKKQKPPVNDDNRAAAIRAYAELMNAAPVMVIQVPERVSRWRVMKNGEIVDIRILDYDLIDFSARVRIGIDQSTSTLYYA